MTHQRRGHKKFQYLGGWIFDGTSGAKGAADYVSKSVRIFSFLRIDPIPKRELVTHNLSGVALFWWLGIKTFMEI